MSQGLQENSTLPRLRAAGATDLAAAMAQAPRPPRTLEYWEPPDEWLDGRQEIALKDRSLEGIPTPGHTRGHLVFLDRAAGSMFAGDHILPRITPSIGFEAAPAPSPLAAYLRSLALVKELPDTQLLPAHGPVTGSTHARADELLAHHERRLAASAAAVAAGARTGWRWPTTSAGPGGSGSSAELDPFNQTLAVLETVAHLTVLVSRPATRPRSTASTTTRREDAMTHLPERDAAGLAPARTGHPGLRAQPGRRAHRSRTARLLQHAEQLGPVGPRRPHGHGQSHHRTTAGSEPPR